jgi:hypothetical protein
MQTKELLVKYLRAARIVLASSAAALTGCGADGGIADATLEEPVGNAEEPVIPGATITQSSKLMQLPAGGSLQGVTATCPSGSMVVGGGYLVHPQTNVYRSNKNGSGWTIDIMNLTAATSSTVNVVAQCLKGTNALSTLYVGQTKTIAPGGHDCTMTKCPSGSILTGGGFAGDSWLHPSGSNPMSNATEWQVCAKNQNNFQSTTLRPYAVCLSGVSGGATRVWSGQQILQPGSERLMQLSCPSGLLMSSGGYAHASHAYARGSHRSFQEPSLWSATFVNQGTTQAAIGMTTTCLELWP